MCNQACDGRHQTGEQGLHITKTRPGAAHQTADLRSGELIDTLPLRGNLSATPDGPETDGNPSGPQREAGLQREQLNQNEFLALSSKLKPTLWFDLSFSPFLVVKV